MPRESEAHGAAEPDLSVVIVSYNVREMLLACLRSLPAATAGLSVEVFVVDNASADDSVARVRAEFPDVRLTASRENLGFTRANNLALREARGRHVLLLNPDTEAEPGSLAALARFLDDNPAVGACGPMLLNTDGSLQKNGARFPTIARELLHATGLWGLAPRYLERRLGYGREDFTVPCPVDQVSGACLLVRGEVMRQVGMLDERFFMYYEEIEWCHRIRRAGWEVWYRPEARVVHHWMGSVRQASRRATEELFRSQVLYYRKTAGPATVLAARLVLGLGIARARFVEAGVAVKRRLRSAGLIR
jgi:N-acetylglucosaminyl-diphospho-decaprenol L-rhamnosyltransferase